MIKRLLLLISAVAFLAGCQLDMTKGLDAASDAYKAATLTQEDAAAMGKEVAAQYDSTNKVAPKNSPYTKRLNKIVANLKTVDGLQLNYKVYLTKDVNAFALPDGSIRVYSGLMDLMDDNELAFVIGHEIGHVKNGDSLDRFRLAYATSAGRKTASAAGGVAKTLSESELGDIGEAFIHAQFSQDQEYNADQYGFELLAKLKKPQKSGVSALRKLAELSGGAGGGWFSSHPESGKRAERLEKQLK